MSSAKLRLVLPCRCRPFCGGSLNVALNPSEVNGHCRVVVGLRLQEDLIPEVALDRIGQCYGVEEMIDGSLPASTPTPHPQPQPASLDRTAGNGASRSLLHTPAKVSSLNRLRSFSRGYRRGRSCPIPAIHRRTG